jgi:hypothetical protein
LFASVGIIKSGLILMMHGANMKKKSNLKKSSKKVGERI